MCLVQRCSAQAWGISLQLSEVGRYQVTLSIAWYLPLPSLPLGMPDLTYGDLSGVWSDAAPLSASPLSVTVVCPDDKVQHMRAADPTLTPPASPAVIPNTMRAAET